LGLTGERKKGPRRDANCFGPKLGGLPSKKKTISRFEGYEKGKRDSLTRSREDWVVWWGRGGKGLLFGVQEKNA